MKRFAGKLLIFLIVLLSAQTAVAALYPFPIPEDILAFQDYLESEVDIIYFGDSTLWYPVSSQTTAEILQGMLPEKTIGEISHAAYGMDVYLAYVEYMVERGYTPELLIIPINMRSFSPEWDQRPEYQFVEEKRILQYGNMLVHLFGRPIDIMGGFSTDITQEEYLLTNVYSGTVPVGQVQEFEDALGSAPLEELAAEQFVYYSEPTEDADQAALLTYYYMYQLTPEHRKVQAMLEIVDLLASSPTEVLFYLTPINVELGEVYLPDAFAQQFARNTGLIVDLLAARDISLIDMTTDLPAFYFSDTEHLRQNGKQYVAGALAETIQPGATAIEELEPPAPTATSVTAEATEAEFDAETVAATAADETPAPADPPANPLLATAMARATLANAPVEDDAAGDTADDAATAAPSPSASEPLASGSATPTVATETPTPAPTPANPLLATTLARSTQAAQEQNGAPANVTPVPPE